jgi:hypothetical protein
MLQEHAPNLLYFHTALILFKKIVTYISVPRRGNKAGVISVDVPNQAADSVERLVFVFGFHFVGSCTVGTVAVAHAANI